MTLKPVSLFPSMVLAALVSAGVPAHASTSATAVIHFSFRDSARGTVVKPDAVLIDNKMVYSIPDEAGRLVVPVTPGDHTVLVKARGYNDLESRQTALPDQAPNNLIMLDPENQPEQLKPENLGIGMPDGGTVIVGFVVDDQSGKPLPGAEVELLEQNQKTTSDAEGFFKLPVPMPDGKQMPEDPRGVLFASRSFRVTKPGFGFDERMNVLVESGAPKVYQIEMLRGGGGNTIDETTGRNNLQSSLFGLSNVEPEDPVTSETAMPLPNVRPPEQGGETTESQVDKGNHSHAGHNH